MQQFCPYGSVRGALGNQRPYRDNTRCGGTASRRFSLRKVYTQQVLPNEVLYHRLLAQSGLAPKKTKNRW